MTSQPDPGCEAIRLAGSYSDHYQPDHKLIGPLQLVNRRIAQNGSPIQLLKGLEESR